MNSLNKFTLRAAASLLVLAGIGLAFAAPNGETVPAPGAITLKLKPEDHIAIIGNALGDRMQFDGWLEALIHTKFAKEQLVFRNLAAAGDEVVTRSRSENFGTPDEWLTKVRADVIFAFFGYNESFKGDAGLPQFKADLDKYIKETSAKNFGGKGAPRIVLFSPIAAERHRDHNFPDPAPINENLRKYAAAMAEVAAANGVQYVDLFGPSQEIYAEAAKQGNSLTVNGIYLTEAGYRELAPLMFQGIFHEPAPSGDVEKIRAAINDKNAKWRSRYRTVDGYNVYGGRSALAYQPEKGGFVTDRNAPAPYVSNYKVMQQEMAQRDVLTANRDKRIWALATGSDLNVDDANLPEVEKVATNHPGQNPDGSHVFLSGEAAIAKMKVPAGCKVNLFASEEEFPELIKPLQMAWDTKGRLWVSVWRNYPERSPTSKVGDSILIFEDTKGTGKADKCTHFIDDLNCPTGFQFYKDGILLMEAPDLWYVRDTTGGDHANYKERVLMGLDSADSHHTTNSMALDPGGAVYLSDGVFHRSQVETNAGPVRNSDAAIYRFEPNTGKFETYISYGFANPHGKAFDYWGTDFVTDATGNNTYFAPAFSGHIDYPAKHPGMKQFWERPSRPCPGTNILTSRHFPEEFQGNFLNCNVISFLGIYRVKVSEDGSGMKGQTLEDLISSSDPNFRPTAVDVGPDGAIYLLDWQNSIIGHMQHHLRDPNRDHVHGRIYRITYESRPLMKPAKIDGQPIPALLALLKEPENQTRELAKIELGKRDSAEVIAAVKQWAGSLDKNDPAYEHHMMEALWVHQWHNVVNTELLGRMLRSPQPEARAAATRVLCYWRDRVPGVLALLKTQAGDESPRVRLEAVRAASFFRVPEAADVALAALNHPTDYYLDYTLTETMKQLEPYVRKAIASGAAVAADNPAGINYLIRSLSTAELLKLPRSEGVTQAILLRPDVPDATRVEALNALKDQRKMTAPAVLLAMMDASKKDAASVAGLAKLLPMQSADDLKALRAQLMTLAEHGRAPDVRQSALAAIATADRSLDGLWTYGAQSPESLIEVLSAIPLIFDQDLRATAYEKVSAQLKPQQPGLPGNPTPGAIGRYVRVELPRRGTLTLAEVQIFSEGRNIAPGGKAKQSSTSNGGAASHAIDGKTDGAYSSGTQTHTKENENNPWWEVDLGSEKPIEAVAVWNRTEGNGQYIKRLDGFTLSVLDGNRRETFKKAAIPAPEESIRIAIGSDIPGSLRRAAIRAAVSINVEQKATFSALVALIEKGEQVAVVARGLRALPRNSWDKQRAGDAAQALVAWAKNVPSAERTSQDYVETVQFAGDLAGLMPPESAQALRKELKELRVAVFVVNTVREQMRYDTPRLVVEAGKPFEVIVENSDFMPHNFCVVTPGSRKKVGEASALMKPEELDSRGRAYIPNLPEILSATRLLEAGQKQNLTIMAPVAPGDYEYVCTFPGHWETMWGRLVVTKDVDAYLQEHPDSALPSAGAASPHVHHGAK